MQQGHEAEVYPTHALLAGVVNRLGDRSSTPVKVDPPKWVTARNVAAAKADLDGARAMFQEYVAQQKRG